MKPRRPTIVIAYVVLVSAVVVAVFPVVWTAVTSLKSQVDAVSYPPQFWGFSPTLGNYTDLLQSSTFYHAALTSIVIALGTTALSVLIATPTAYALVRLRVPLKRALVLLIVLVQTIPGIVLVIPLFTLFANYGLYDTWRGLILVYAALTVPFATWVLVAFLRTLPPELEEAAFVDGASRLQVVRFVVLPLLLPGLATTAIFSAIGAWNEFLMPVILAESSAQPLTVYVTQFVTQKVVDWGHLTAAVVAIMIPIVAFVVVAQKYLIKGLTLGSLKG